MQPEIQDNIPNRSRELRQEVAEEEEESVLAAKEQPGRTPFVTLAMDTRISAMRGGDRPRPESSRAFFEPRFAQDFSHVRIHADDRTVREAGVAHAAGPRHSQP